MAKKRVEAVRLYLLENQGRFTRRVRVLFSCGWAAGVGQSRPPEDRREAVLMREYAMNELGMGALQWVDFGVQADSSTTMGDAVYSARSGFFGARPFDYGEANPLGVVAQAGLNGRPGHMGRCLYAACKAYGVDGASLLPIFAEGEDRPETGLSEELATHLTRVLTAGVNSYDGLMRVDRLMTLGARMLQKLRAWRVTPRCS